MTPSNVLVELCAGTASVSLYALGRVPPLTGMMGSKRRWAAQLTHALRVDAPRVVVLVDAGPWGDTWSVLQFARERAAVAEQLDEWCREDLAQLWSWLVQEPPSSIASRRVAQFLWLQARSAGTIPVWWSADASRWESPTGSRTEAAHTRGGGARARREKGAASASESSRKDGPAYEAGWSRDTRGGSAAHKGRCRGIQYPSTIARRVRALDRLDWDRVRVRYGDVRNESPIPGARVLFDPPYQGAPRYPVLLPRSDVLEIAQRWAAVGATVAVCEKVPLPLDGWTIRKLARGEWITANGPLALAEQLPLFEEVA